MKKESFYSDPNDIEGPDGILDPMKVIKGSELRSNLGQIDRIKRGKCRVVPRKKNLSQVDGDFE